MTTDSLAVAAYAALVVLRGITSYTDRSGYTFADAPSRLKTLVDALETAGRPYWNNGAIRRAAGEFVELETAESDRDHQECAATNAERVAAGLPPRDAE